MNAANALTASRIFLAPVFAWLIYTSRWQLALLVFAIAIITDLVDGYVARRFKQETALGKLLDPVADKVFFGVGTIVIILKSGLPPYYFLAMTRDVLIGIGGLYALAKSEDRKKMEFSPSWWGKGTTAFQALTIIAIMLQLLGFAVRAQVVDFLVLVTFMLGVITVWHYLTMAIKKGYI